MQGSARHELHHQKVHAVLRIEIENRADVRMIQASQRQRLIAESLARPRIRQQPRRQHLQRNVPLQPQIPRAVHHTHPANPNLLNHLVMAERLAHHGGHLSLAGWSAPVHPLSTNRSARRCAHPLLVSIVIRAQQVQRNVWRLAHHPAVVPRRNEKNIPRAKLVNRAVIHRRRRRARNHDSHVFHLATLGAGRSARVRRPFPTRLVRRPPQRHPADAHNLEPAFFKCANFVRRIKSLQNHFEHGRSPRARAGPLDAALAEEDATPSALWPAIRQIFPCVVPVRSQPYTAFVVWRCLPAFVTMGLRCLPSAKLEEKREGETPREIEVQGLGRLLSSSANYVPCSSPARIKCPVDSWIPGAKKSALAVLHWPLDPQLPHARL